MKYQVLILIVLSMTACGRGKKSSQPKTPTTAGMAIASSEVRATAAGDIVTEGTQLRFQNVEQGKPEAINKVKGKTLDCPSYFPGNGSVVLYHLGGQTEMQLPPDKR